MDEAVDLIGAVLRQADSEQARRVLVLAEEAGVDPLALCAHRFGLGATVVWERAAVWAGLAFFPEIPVGALTGPPPEKLDALAEAHTAGGKLFERPVVFAAPSLTEIVALKRAAAARPHVTARLCIVPPARLRAALAAHHAPSLMASARQRLTRRWPTASAHLDLTLGIRIGFILAGIAVMALVLAAPFFLRPLLMPVTALLLMAPAALRLLAVVPGLVPPPLAAPAEIADTALPVYSVLVPLRNEVHMVESLARALGNLDYPVLCSSHT